MRNLDNLILIYKDDEGNAYEQVASDLQDVGTLIHPDTGDDLDLVSFRIEGI